MDIPTPPGLANTPPSSSYKIEGYADQLSVRAGDDIAFHISSDVETYALEISRVGADRQEVHVGAVGAYRASAVETRVTRVEITSGRAVIWATTGI